MPIQINDTKVKEDIWAFFVSWLTKLKSLKPEFAFLEIDDPSNKGLIWDTQLFSQLLLEFSGNKKEVYRISDISLDPQNIKDYFSDSSYTLFAPGIVYALLYLPLIEKGSHVLVLDFYFRKTENGDYRVALNCDDPIVL